jgi:nucleotide-binding universal stress UspA family protein
MTKRPILHPTDFSAASRRAFRNAVELATAQRSALLILHVLNPTHPVAVGQAFSPPTFAEYQKVVRASAWKQLGRLVRRAEAAGVRATPLLADGAEGQEIARVARARRASTIVMGTHGRTGFGKLMLGSVAARVLRVAPCPVLTVRGG